ncbi:type II toxin-antitoxin system RelE/ParE family toxin [Bordetella genomosp. 13]|uniref:Addiction module antitoxin RelB n=1 Tax=Bordetella genomosp. 13 TaxID=463040 RepID=A0A1W6ZH94_9BORD|nr:type II toxin-antitoxin system RelE/ParE family toxin [Bordetella genomosp. 13]ARP96783.1 addiction module antitoxin RelB [Bordetella genomosp. 13]
MTELLQTDTFKDWMHRLRDTRARTAIAARLARLAAGLAGDVEPVGGGVFEMRVHHGPGYRVYFKRHRDVMIILLCAGDKRTQRRDIERAKRMVGEME